MTTGAVVSPLRSQLRSLGRARSVLIAPAVRPDFLTKLPGRGADLVLIDCEDAVPTNSKAQARTTARQVVAELARAGCRVLVRVNAIDSSWFLDDIADGISPDVIAVVIPKIESIESLEVASRAMDSAGLHGLGLVAGLETALGVADARTLLAHPRVIGAYFGAEDFIADMGGVRTAGNAEVAFARSATVLAGRLAGVRMLDQVVTDFRNDAAFGREAVEARNMGYVGKLCVHPGQVQLANDAFTPSAAEIEWARKMLAAYDSASSMGLAAIDVDGQMVDEPLAVQARNLLARIEGDLR